MNSSLCLASDDSLDRFLTRFGYSFELWCSHCDSLFESGLVWDAAGGVWRDRSGVISCSIPKRSVSCLVKSEKNWLTF